MIGTDESVQLLGEDLLVGAAAIADFLGFGRRQVYKFVERGYLPVFRIGALVCARRSTLVDWIARQEQGTADALVDPARASLSWGPSSQASGRSSTPVP